MLGRLLHDRVTDLGDQDEYVDGSVRRISRTYEVRGMLEKVTSHDNATVGSGSVVNEVQLVYNSFSQLTAEYQAHGGAVNTSTSPKVQYAYASGASSSNQIRPTSMTYPNARQIDSNYGTGSGMNDYLNRVEAIKDGATSLAAYTYLGAGTIIRIDYAEPEVRLDLWNEDDESGVFDGFDRFGRIVDQRWENSSGDVDRYAYGYDRNSNRLWKQNVVSGGLDTPVPLDEYYTYDNLNRLTVMKRGTLTGSPPTGISGTPVRELDWTLDPTGNWSAYVTHTGTTKDLDQGRTANTVNEITAIAGTPNWADPVYDAAGNTTSFPKASDPTSAFTAKYDAWNRMVLVTDGEDTVATYEYDGRGRRIVKITGDPEEPDETRHFYFTNDWQDIEERLGASPNNADPQLQYVWGIRYVDELVCRDRTVSGSNERLYACQDANFNLTSIINASGTVVERYVFDPYGNRSVRDTSWGVLSASAYAWVVGHQGLMYDTATGLVYNRMRCLMSPLGTFLRRDPLGYPNGMGIYEYQDGNPVTFLDPMGLSVGKGTGKPPDRPVGRITSCDVAFSVGFPVEHTEVIVKTNLGWYTLNGQGPWDVGITIDAPKGTPPTAQYMTMSVDKCECLLGWDHSSRVAEFNTNIRNRGIGYNTHGTNSNWALRCWMNNCLATIKWEAFDRKPPPGWNCDTKCPPGVVTDVQPPPPALDPVPLPPDPTDERLRWSVPVRYIGLTLEGDPLPDNPAGGRRVPGAHINR